MTAPPCFSLLTDANSPAAALARVRTILAEVRIPVYRACLTTIYGGSVS